MGIQASLLSTEAQARQVSGSVAFAAVVLAIVAVGNEAFFGVVLPLLAALIGATVAYQYVMRGQPDTVAQNVCLVIAGVALVMSYFQWAYSPAASILLVVFPVLSRSMADNALFIKANAAFLFTVVVLILVAPVDEVSSLTLADRVVIVSFVTFFAIFNLSQRVLEHKRSMNLASDCVHDPLTHLLNRRGIDLFLGHHLAAARRNVEGVAVLMVDIDHFKRFNDRYGHSCGDEALRQVSSCMNSVLRDVDQAGRMGGEEFLIVLPRTKAVEAIWVAERVRQKLADLELSNIEQGLMLTVSIGVAISNNQSSIESLIHSADQALYKAKRKGRNRCESNSD